MMRLLSLVFLGMLCFWACSGEYVADMFMEEDMSSSAYSSSENSSSENSSALSSSISSSSGMLSSAKASSSSVLLESLGLPPAGFYSTLTLDEPHATQGGIVSCTMDGSEPKEIAAPASYAQVLQKNTVVRCYEFLDSKIVAKQTETYFIGENVSMPVVALSVPPVFFSNYVAASPCKPDPCKSAAFWDDVEFPVHVEYFADGSGSKQKAFEIDAGISIMGGWSRNQVKKSVSVVMRKEYQDGRLKYPLFETRPEAKKFKAFILRNNGNRFVSDYIEDPMAVSLLEGTTVDYQRSRQVVVFYNGTYYGIHDMREKLNEHFVETNYGIDSKEVDFIKHTDKTIKVANGSSASYEEMLNFAAASDFSDLAGDALEKISRMLDLQNYADYMAAEIYFHNGDWPNNNVRAWHTATQPWRFVAFDIDHGFDWTWNVSGFSRQTNMFDWIAGGGTSSCRNSTNALCFHNLFVKLIQSRVFQRIFINRACVLYSLYVNSNQVAAHTDAMVATMPVSDIARDINVFPRDDYWYSNTCGNGFETDGYCLKIWAYSRDAGVRAEFRKRFELGEDVSVSVNAQGPGYVAVEGARLPANYQGMFFKGYPIVLTAESSGGVFVQWEDGSTDNPRVVIPTGKTTYQATFK
ncbi:CotH kinase family protein [Fibrobacter sp. UBA4309]|uniref:CotH kinase family protein n=1 Tax=Fibrobacter sp. UBA4309 TaxID=1946537 RepID=UPI0025C57308|nr:CotH kinase family protein [Fibrobacter sp. UBA4309]